MNTAIAERPSVIAGQVYGRLLVVGLAPANARGPHYLCACECGAEIIVRGRDLTRGQHGTKSCGCLRKDALRRTATTHGHTAQQRTPTFNSWRAMWDRCTRSAHPYYHNYGGRGIRICDRWKEFPAFLADMGERPIAGTLDRIDTNGDYEPGNCRWASRSEQAQNRRRPS